MKFDAKSLLVPNVIGKALMGVGAIAGVLQVFAIKGSFVDLSKIAKNPLKGADKFFNSFRGLLFGGENHVDYYSFASFIGYFWLGLIAAALIVVGYRISQEEKIQGWMYLTIPGVTLCVIMFFCMLFTSCNSIFSLTESTARSVKIIQYFWEAFLGLPLVIAGHFVKKHFAKKHAIAIGEIEAKPKKAKKVKAKA